MHKVSKESWLQARRDRRNVPQQGGPFCNRMFLIYRGTFRPDRSAFPGEVAELQIPPRHAGTGRLRSG